jgi:hypothetical protein
MFHIKLLVAVSKVFCSCSHSYMYIGSLLTDENICSVTNGTDIKETKFERDHKMLIFLLQNDVIHFYNSGHYI